MSESVLQRIVRDKWREVEERRARVSEEELAELARARSDFRSLSESLRAPGVRVIAEIKRASPSKGVLCGDLHPAQVARQYADGGAAALSVLTESRYFLGSDQDLKDARATVALPVLRKDFILCPYQVYETAALGADAVLLIVRVLDDSALRDLFRLSADIGLDALVEVHDERDLHRIRGLGAAIIGINNRDLASFRTDLQTAPQIARQIGDEAMAVALSGIFSADDVSLNLRAGLRRFLIGEALVRSADPARALRELANIPVPEGLR